MRSGGNVFSHLGMSGSWQIGTEASLNKHAHIKFIAKNNGEQKILSYIDPRRFGHLYILNAKNAVEKLSKFSIDVASLNFNENIIADLFFRNSGKKLKPFLLDQQAFLGIGNYMASEICARAGIHPERLVGNITQNEILNIKTAISDVIEGALKTKGTAFSGGYRDLFGDDSKKLDHLVVFFQKTCQLCEAKGLTTKIIKNNLGGRGTYYCPRCQK